MGDMTTPEFKMGSYRLGEVSPRRRFEAKLGTTVAAYVESDPVGGVVKWCVEMLPTGRKCKACGGTGFAPA